MAWSPTLTFDDRKESIDDCQYRFEGRDDIAVRFRPGRVRTGEAGSAASPCPRPGDFCLVCRDQHRRPGPSLLPTLSGYSVLFSDLSRSGSPDHLVVLSGLAGATF